MATANLVMRIFCGGQIKSEYRGREAVVVTRNEKGGAHYRASSHDILSDEFISSTYIGVDEHYLVERVYMHISHDIARAIVHGVDHWREDIANLPGIDELIVDSKVLESMPEPEPVRKYDDHPPSMGGREGRV